MPTFWETELDSYFGAFERLALALQWPSDVWSLLLQCKIHGKAQEAVAALSLEESLSYDAIKAAILRTYELVLSFDKSSEITKKVTLKLLWNLLEKSLFDKWITACHVEDFNSLCEMILLEEFKKCLPERLVVYLNE